MSVRFDAAGDEANRTANLPPNAGFTYMVHAVLDTDRGTGNYQPVFFVLDAGNTSGYSLGLISNQLDLEVHTSGGTVSSLMGSRPALGTPACFFMRSAGIGANQFTGGYRIPGQNSFVTSQGTLGGIGAAATLYVGGAFSTYWTDGRKWGLKIWDRALSDAELLIESFHREVKSSTSLNLWAPLDNAADLGDKSGNSRNLTAVGTLTTGVTPGGLWTPSRRIFLPQASGSVTDLVIASGSHGHTAENLTLTTDATLSIASATHAHVAGSLSLSTALALVVGDAVHAHAADALTLSTGTSLAVDGATHAHQADNVTLSTALALAVDNAVHAHTAGNLDLSTAVLLAVDGATHAHAADNVVLDTTVGANLIIAGAVHAHVAGDIVLTTDTALIIANALHAHAADQLALSVESVLAVANATHGHFADNVTLSTADVIALNIADALHAHAADNLDLNLVFSVSLVISDATHAHVAQSVVLSLPGGYPDVGDVRKGVSYGPTGIEYVGTFKGGKGMVWLRRR